MNATALKAGFDDPVRDSQNAFRRILEAMSQPGRIVLPPSPPELPQGLHPAAAAACLTLLDFETPLWIAGDHAETRAWLAFHAGCPFAAGPDAAAFALILDAADLPALTAFAQGSDEMPESGATLIVQTRGLAAGSQTGGRGKRLYGPGIPERGIENSRLLAAEGLGESFWDERDEICAQFPRGLDVILTAGRALAALPRTTRAED